MKRRLEMSSFFDKSPLWSKNWDSIASFLGDETSRQDLVRSDGCRETADFLLPSTVIASVCQSAHLNSSFIPDIFSRILIMKVCFEFTRERTRVPANFWIGSREEKLSYQTTVSDCSDDLFEVFDFQKPNGGQHLCDLNVLERDVEQLCLCREWVNSSSEHIHWLTRSNLDYRKWTWTNTTRVSSKQWMLTRKKSA
jgi:hypothetical protein